MSSKTLLVLDAYALIYRAYFAFISRPIKTSKGQNTSAIFGFTKSLLDALKRFDPTHIAVAFDISGKTFRSEMYPDYKANRQETPEDIRSAIPVIKDIIRAMNITILEKQGYEADDIVGTLAKKAEPAGFEVMMMTPDKDYGQLLTDKVVMVKPSRSGADIETVTAADFCKKYGITNPSQFKDILALWGDSSDNIPGVPGIGEKTAAKLIAQYGSIEEIYNKIDELSKGQREKLLENREQLNLARVLVEIKTDVPVDINFDRLERTQPNSEELKKLFDELEFRALSRDIFGEAKSQEKPKAVQTSLFGDADFHSPLIESALNTITDVEYSYKLVENETDIDELVKILSSVAEFSFDTETTGLEHHTSKLVGLSFSVKKHEAWYVPIPADEEQGIRILNKLKPVFENDTIAKIGQNIKFDLLMLKYYGIELYGKLNDTMLAHYLLEPEMRHNLNVLSENLLGYKPIEIEELLGKKGARQLNMRNIDPKEITNYACEDADLALQLKSILWERLVKENLDSLYYKLEEPLIRVLAQMEYEGVTINSKVLNDYAVELNKELMQLDSEIKEMAGVPDLNVSSPKQLGEVLFERMKIAPDAKRTKTKQFSTSEEELMKYADSHPIVSKILDFRSVKKLLSTYVEVLPTLTNKQTGKIHASFNQAVASTGRLSSNNPNLQNIPIREERGREIRRAFVASGSEYTFLSADYSQIELRLMAHVSQDPSMLEAFQSGEDIHAATASKIFKVSLSEVTREQRSRAKTANFGMIYGISAFGLSQRLGISRTEAKELIDGYFETYKGVKAYMDSCVEQARKKGYVETIYGRKRYLPDINSNNQTVRGLAERNAINAPIQGSAADIIKVAMISIHHRIMQQGLKSRMIIQVHDELNFDVYKPELETMKALVKDCMENAIKLSVPLEVDMGEGDNWLEAH
jgi:DNA polymerase-1